MSFLDKIAEIKLQEAVRKGELDDLSFMNKPLVFEDETFVPEDLRASYKILKNAGILPEEMQLKKEIYTLEEMIKNSELSDEQLKTEREKLFEKIIKYKSFVESKR
ncbi:MAG: DnaJ family domain-containing protein [Candidatus Sericytochromatia bacterium]